MRERVRKILLAWALKIMRRPYDVAIGGDANPYLLRWHVIPRNRFFNIYLHKFLRDDDDRALHDHPWPSVSMLLRGALVEIRQSAYFPSNWLIRKIIRCGALRFRRARFAHRLALPSDLGFPLRPPHPITLFITGPRIREWGFHCPQGWVPWHRFVSPENPGEIGRGCE